MSCEIWKRRSFALNALTAQLGSYNSFCFVCWLICCNISCIALGALWPQLISRATKLHVSSICIIDIVLNLFTTREYLVDELMSKKLFLLLQCGSGLLFASYNGARFVTNESITTTLWRYVVHLREHRWSMKFTWSSWSDTEWWL